MVAHCHKWPLLASDSHLIGQIVSKNIFILHLDNDTIGII